MSRSRISGFWLMRTTLIVGRNNSGKTSLSEAIRRFLADPSPRFHIEDFSNASCDGFCEARKAENAGQHDDEVRALIPSITAAGNAASGIPPGAEPSRGCKGPVIRFGPRQHACRAMSTASRRTRDMAEICASRRNSHDLWCTASARPGPKERADGGPVGVDGACIVERKTNLHGADKLQATRGRIHPCRAAASGHLLRCIGSSKTRVTPGNRPAGYAARPCSRCSRHQS